MSSTAVARLLCTVEPPVSSSEHVAVVLTYDSYLLQHRTSLRSVPGTLVATLLGLLPSVAAGCVVVLQRVVQLRACSCRWYLELLHELGSTNGLGAHAVPKRIDELLARPVAILAPRWDRLLCYAMSIPGCCLLLSHSALSGCTHNSEDAQAQAQHKTVLRYIGTTSGTQRFV